MIKQLSGNEDIPINPKGSTPYSLNKDYVPKTLLVANNMPIFKNISEAIIERSVIIEFNVKFRDTEREDKHLLDNILDNPEEVEFLIKEGLKAFKEMEDNKEDFILRVNKERTLELLNKHSKPINYLIRKLVSKCDEVASETEEHLGSKAIFTNDLNNYCLRLAKEEGIEIPVNNKGMIYKNRMLKAIKEEFDLEGVIFKDKKEYHVKTGYNSKTGKKERFYPYLIKSELYIKYENEEENVEDSSSGNTF